MSTILINRLKQADMIGLSVDEIVTRLNTPDTSLPQTTVLKTTRIGPGTVMEVLGPEGGSALLDALTTLAPTNPPIRWALKILDRGEFDISVVGARAQVDGLATAGVITNAQAAALKALAEVTQHKSWAQHNQITVDRSSVVSALSNNQAVVWIPAGTPVPGTNYVVSQEGVYSPSALVGCSSEAGLPPTVSYSASYIINKAQT